MVWIKRIRRKAGLVVEKQRLFKMGMLEQNFLVKALCDAQKASGPEISGEVQSLIDKTVNAPKGKLYLIKRDAQRLPVGGQEQRRHRPCPCKAHE